MEKCHDNNTSHIDNCQMINTIEVLLFYHDNLFESIFKTNNIVFAMFAVIPMRFFYLQTPIEIKAFVMNLIFHFYIKIYCH